MDLSFLLGGAGGAVQMPDPVLQYSTAMSLAQLARQNRVGDLAEREQARKLEEEDAYRQALPALLQAGFSRDAVLQAIQANPKIGPRAIKEADDRVKAKADLAKTEAGTLKDSVEAKSKAFNDIASVAYAEAQNPNPSLSRVKRVADFYGVPLPPLGGDDPESLRGYIQSLADAGISVKDQIAVKQKDRDWSSGEIEKLWRREFDTGKQAETGRHNKAVERSSMISAGAAASNAGTAAERLKYEKEQGKAGSVQVGPNGEMYVVDPRNATGRPVMGPDGQPLTKGSTRAPEAYSKQVSGIENLNTAIAEYKDALAKWGNTSLLSPAALAEMGTAYNNMMLQSKEAYNLGVLNGPDYSILTTVVTDPATFKGAITPNSALAGQADALGSIMAKNAANLARIYKQPVPDVAKGAAPSAAAPAKPKIGEVRDGYIFKGGDPGNRNSWDKL